MAYNEIATKNYVDTNAVLESEVDGVAIDATPTDGSSNLVTSGGVKGYVDGKTPYIFDIASDIVIFKKQTSYDEGSCVYSVSELKYYACVADSAGGRTIAQRVSANEFVEVPVFSRTAGVSYSVGDFVQYRENVFLCTEATSGGTFDESAWAVFFYAYSTSATAESISAAKDAGRIVLAKLNTSVFKLDVLSQTQAIFSCISENEILKIVCKFGTPNLVLSAAYNLPDEVAQ